MMVKNEIQMLEFLKINCLSTGSRYWSSLAPELIKINEMTDYDFVVSEFDPVIKDALNLAVKLDCRVTEFLDYDLDPSTYGVYCFGAYLQLVVKFDPWYKAYMKVQSLCTPEYYYNFLWKNNNTPKEKVRERLICLMSFFLDDLEAVKKEKKTFEYIVPVDELIHI